MRPPEPAAIAAERARLMAFAAARRGHQVDRADLGTRAPADRENHRPAPFALHKKPGRAPAEPPAAGPVARPDERFSRRRPRIGYLGEDWLHWAETKRMPLTALMVVAVLLFFGLRYGIGKITDRRLLQTEAPLPSFFERAKSAAWVAPLRALPAIAAGVLLYGGLDALDLLFPPWGRCCRRRAQGGHYLFGALGADLRRARPNAPQWRMVALADAPTRRIGLLLCAITAVYAIDGALTEISRVFFVPLALSVVQSFVASTGFAALLMGLLLTPFTPPMADPPPQSRGSRGCLGQRACLSACAALAQAAALADRAQHPGVRGARLRRPGAFHRPAVVLTGIVVAVGGLLYLAIRAVTREPQQRRFPSARCSRPASASTRRAAPSWRA